MTAQDHDVSDPYQISPAPSKLAILAPITQLAPRAFGLSPGFS